MRYISAPQRSHVILSASDAGSDPFLISVMIGGGVGFRGGVGAGESGMWPRIIASHPPNEPFP
jgi:hypothetical protein